MSERYEFIGKLQPVVRQENGGVSSETVSLYQCHDCGAAVSAMSRHDDWHALQSATPTDEASTRASGEQLTPPRDAE